MCSLLHDFHPSDGVAIRLWRDVASQVQLHAVGSACRVQRATQCAGMQLCFAGMACTQSCVTAVSTTGEGQRSKHGVEKLKHLRLAVGSEHMSKCECMCVSSSIVTGLL